MKTRISLIAGAVLLILGAVVLAASAQVLGTFLLELVTHTLTFAPTEQLEPVTYSWGTMKWGNMDSDFFMVALACVLIALGHCLALPATMGRIKAPDARATLLPKVALIGAAVLTAVAAASLFYMGWASRSAFGMLATTGAADPTMLGESLPVRSAQVFMILMVIAQLLVAVASIVAARQPVSDSPLRVRSILAILSCVCVVLVAVGMVSTYLGPVSTFTLLVSSTGSMDPSTLAEEISRGINTMLFSAPLLGVAAILLLLAVAIPGRRRTSVG